MQPPPRYIDGLTPLRGFAALWVVAYHYDDIIHHLLPRASTTLLSRGYLMVDFFFVLSGFVICHVYGDRLTARDGGLRARDYLRARFFRLYPLHAFALGLHLLFYVALLAAAPALFVKAKLPGVYYLPTLPSHLLLGQTIGLGGSFTWNIPSWSISAEWWTYLLALLIVPRLHSRRADIYRFVWPALVAGACVAGLYLAQTYLGKGRLNLLDRGGLLRCVLEFTLGLCVYQFYRHLPKSALGDDAWFFVPLIAVLLMMHKGRSDMLLVLAFAGLILAAACNEGRVRRFFGARPMRLFGDLSYAVYMLHYLLILAIVTAQTALTGTTKRVPYSPAAFALLTLAFLAVLFGAAALAHRYVEVPARRWGHGPRPDFSLGRRAWP